MSSTMWMKIIAATVTATVFAFVSGSIANIAYHVDYLSTPAYQVADLTEPRIDLTALRRSWPATLSGREDRTRLRGYIDAIADVRVAAVEPATAPVPKLEESVAIRLAKADPANGEAVMRKWKCNTCHTFDQTGRDLVGPNLWGIVGREVAGRSGFNYTDEMRAHGGSWTFEELDLFLKQPAARIPGTRMAFGGIRAAQDRADVLAYLRGMSGSPMPLPEPSADDTAALPEVDVQ